MSGDPIDIARAKALGTARDTKAELLAMVDALDDLLHRWDHGTNPIFHSAAGQIRQALRAAKADAR